MKSKKSVSVERCTNLNKLQMVVRSVTESLPDHLDCCNCEDNISCIEQVIKSAHLQLDGHVAAEAQKNMFGCFDCDKLEGCLESLFSLEKAMSTNTDEEDAVEEHSENVQEPVFNDYYGRLFMRLIDNWVYDMTGECWNEKAYGYEESDLIIG